MNRSIEGDSCLFNSRRKTPVSLLVLVTLSCVDAQADTKATRSRAQFILERSQDNAAVDRAEEYLELTGVRLWTYRNSRNEEKFQKWKFEKEITSNGRRWTKFEKYQAIPRDVLSNDDQRVIDRIAELQRLLARDVRNTQRAMEAEQIRREEEERRNSIRRILINRHTIATVRVGNTTREVTLPSGEVFDILGETNGHFKIEVGGREAFVSKRDATEIEPRPGSYTTLKPPIGDDEGDSLNLGIDFDYEFVAPDVVHIVVNEVISGGMAWRKGIRRGEEIRQVNDRRIQSPNDFLTSILNQRSVKLTVWNPNRRPPLRYVTIVAETKKSTRTLSFGVRGHKDPNGEFVVDFVEPGANLGWIINLSRGDKILAVDRQRIRQESDLDAALKKARNKLVVTVLRRGHVKHLELDLDAVEDELSTLAEP